MKFVKKDTGLLVPLQDLLDIDKIKKYAAQEHSDPVKKQVKKRLEGAGKKASEALKKSLPSHFY